MGAPQTETYETIFAVPADVRTALRAQGISVLDVIGMEDPGDTDDDARYAVERLNQEQADRPGQARQDDGPASTPEERIARVIAFAEGLGRKAEINDIDRQTLRDAGTWVHAYTGGFEFLSDLKEKGGVKSAGQAKGVVNCIRADIARGGTGQPAQAPQEAAEAAPQAQGGWDRVNRYAGTCVCCGRRVGEEQGRTHKNAQTAKWEVSCGPTPDDCPARTETEAEKGYDRAAPQAPLAAVPAGHYAICSTGDNDLAFYRIDRPTEGTYSGRVFVKMIVGGHPEMNVKGAAVPGILARIEAAGIAESAALYGRELGRCSACNRTLTDETSRALGIGPECRSKGI